MTPQFLSLCFIFIFLIYKNIFMNYYDKILNYNNLKYDTYEIFDIF
jgi:hypothetical protein